MPFAAPNAMIPIRMELRGSYNNQTRFHAIGDYVNFLSTPPSDLDNVQVCCTIDVKNWISYIPNNRQPRFTAEVLYATFYKISKIRATIAI